MTVPALTDTSIMSFGQHKGKRLIDVPAKYLIYIYDKGWITDPNVKQYVIKNLNFLKKEAGDYKR